MKYVNYVKYVLYVKYVKENAVLHKEAVQVLGMFKQYADDKLILSIIEYLASDSFAVRQTAQDALTALGQTCKDKHAVTEIVKFFVDKCKDKTEAFRAAVTAIGKLKEQAEKEDIVNIRKLLESKEPIERQFAAEAFASLGHYAADAQQVKQVALYIKDEMKVCRRGTAGTETCRFD